MDIISNSFNLYNLSIEMVESKSLLDKFYTSYKALIDGYSGCSKPTLKLPR